MPTPAEPGSLEELAATFGVSCREVARPDASNAQHKRIRRRNAELTRLQRGHQATTAPRSAPRPRGAGRPAARRSAASSSTSSADPADPPPPAAAQPRATITHLTNAARTLERILAAKGPQHPFIVHVRQSEGDQASGLPATPLGQPQAGTVSDDPHPLVEGNLDTAATGAPDHDRGEQAT